MTDKKISFQNMKQGPVTKLNVVWKSQRERHLPNVTKFQPPDNFLEQLNSQKYGPTTVLIANKVSGSSSIYVGGGVFSLPPPPLDLAPLRFPAKG